MKKFLEKTELLNFTHKDIQKLIHTRKWAELDDFEKIRKNEEAFIMLLNSMKASSSAYQESNAKVAELNEKIIQFLFVIS